MVRQTILAITTCLFLVMGLATASAQHPSGSTGTPAVNLAATPIAFSVPAPAAPQGSLIEQAQGRSCRRCRRYCYREFRLDCGYSNWCRRRFTRCMRNCWYDYCR